MLGNIEIAIENIEKERLDDFLDFIAYSAELMGFEMVGRAYMTPEDEEDETDEAGNAKEPSTAS